MGILDLLFGKNKKSKKSNKKQSNYYKKNSYKAKSTKKTINTAKDVAYTAKPYYSKFEAIIFKRIVNAVEDKYLVYPQINLVSILNKESNQKYRAELFRNIDFGLFDKESKMPVMLIELNDKSHKEAERYQRDLKIREIIEKANIPLLTLYTGYENEESYIKKRIDGILNDKKED